ncbi:hypothetical protein BD289DRAFT_358558 [Coniella lustricola]|uniref:PHD-type domain-containing protein n=1 Tax=Coniella lustricola TaxID=2025994 RepID=A0A2T3AN75_9PEZI|nr:hypothetical protein BD289DRAFT_358558 [Coniella lustricola]
MRDDDPELSPRQTSPSMPGPIDSLGSSLGSLEGRADPDAQATVTDFLEFTEHLPADMMRSLILIGKLDHDYADASTRLHELAKTWGQLPSLPAHEKPQPVKLRGNISEELNNVMTSRVYSHAEAVRMAENVKRHVNRLKMIHAKLRAMLDKYPAEDEARSPVALTRSPQATRANKRQPAGGEKGRRPRGPRITVPGEVLAPFDVGYGTGSSEGDSSDEDEEEEVLGHGRTLAAQSGNQKSRGRKPPSEKTPKVPKLKLSKIITQVPIPPTAAPAIPAEPVLRPPPPDAPVGSDDAPWFQLTQYELARLRKRMKKNVAWVPSDTMINRELKLLGRGYDGWTSAKKKAEETGLPFEPILPQLIVDDVTGTEHLPMGAVSLDSAMAAEDRNLTNRGIDLNKAKKLKKDRLSDQAAKEAEESARQIARIARDLQVSFQQPQPSSQPQTKNTKRQQKKRKRDSVSEADAEKPDLVILKRSKTETPVPIPRHISMPRNNTLQPCQVTPAIQIPQSTTPVPIPIPGHDHSIMVGAKWSNATSPAASTDASTATGAVTANTLVSESSTSKKSNTPILPPVRETRAREAKAKEKAAGPHPIKTTDSRGNTPSATSPGLELPSRRPSSRGTTTGQEAGQQTGLAAERSRRASTARNTPAPDMSLRQPSKRIKRPAPGIISRTNSGGNNSAITKRKAAPRKSKRGSQKRERGQTTEAEAEVEVDEEGNVIDPNEARYCFCNRVSFGTMVMCENDSCKYEWFHLECLGLHNAAGLAKTWYCSDCKAQQGVDEKAEGSKRTTRRGA